MNAARHAVLAAAMILAAAAPALSQVPLGQWKDGPGVPSPVGQGGQAIAAGPDTVIILCGSTWNSVSNRGAVYRHTPSTKAWTELAPSPSQPLPTPIPVPPPPPVPRRIIAATWQPASSNIYCVVEGSNSNLQLHRLDFADGPTGSWSYVREVSGQMYPWGIAIAATSTRLYAFNEVWGNRFSELDLADPSGPWIERPQLTDANGFTLGTSYGAVLSYPGWGSHLYALTGGTEGRFFSYSTLTNKWTELGLPAAPIVLSQGSALAGGPSGRLHVLAAGTRLPDGWSISQHTPRLLRYDVNLDTGSGAWTDQAPLPGSLLTVPTSGGWIGDGTGSGLAYAVSTDQVLALRGNSTTDLWRWRGGSGRFDGATPSPGIIGAGGTAALSKDGRTIYVLAGGGSAAFWAYSIAEDRWTALVDLPVAPGPGASIVHLYDDFLYVAPGGGLAHVWRYYFNGSAPTWGEGTWWDTDDFNTPGLWETGVGAGAKIIGVPGDNMLYAAVGGDRPNFYRVPVSADPWPAEWFDWMALESAPGPIGDGGSLAYPGSGDRIYALAGGMSNSFWFFSISQQRWNVLENGSPADPADLPGDLRTAVHSGGALAAASGDEVYAFVGSHDNSGVDRFWRYRSGGWAAQALPPGSIHSGASLVAAPGSYLFATQGNLTRSLWRCRVANSAPAAPATTGQFRSVGGAPIDAGASIPETSFVAAAAVADPELDRVAVRVEVKPAGVPFDGTGTLTGPMLAMDQSIVTVAGLLRGTAYHWRACSVDEFGAESAWVFHGGNDDPDLSIRSNGAPAASTSAQRRATDGGTIVVGHGLLSGVPVRFEATLDDPDGDAGALSIEVRPVGQAFTGEATMTSAPVADGERAAMELELPVGRYHWQLLWRDSFDLAGAWTSFGGNDEGEADFSVDPAGSTGAAGCSQSAGGPPAAAALLLLAFLARRR